MPTNVFLKVSKYLELREISYTCLKVECFMFILQCYGWSADGAASIRSSVKICNGYHIKLIGGWDRQSLASHSPSLNPLPSRLGSTKFFAVRSAWRQHELSNSYKVLTLFFQRTKCWWYGYGYGYVGEADSGLNKQTVHFYMSLEFGMFKEIYFYWDCCAMVQAIGLFTCDVFKVIISQVHPYADTEMVMMFFCIGCC